MSAILRKAFAEGIVSTIVVGLDAKEIKINLQIDQFLTYTSIIYVGNHASESNQTHNKAGTKIDVLLESYGMYSSSISPLSEMRFI